MPRTKNTTAKETEAFDKYIKDNPHLNAQQIADKFGKHRTTYFKAIKRIKK